MGLRLSCKLSLKLPKALATPFVSVYVSRTCVRHFELYLTMISCQTFDGFDLIWQDYTLYCRKLTLVWRFHHLCPSINGSSTFPSVSAHRLMDVDIQTWTGLAYPMQDNAVLLLTDTDTDRCSLALRIFCSFLQFLHYYCYAGGLICRAVLQMMDNHNVENFISLSSPQAGQYGGRC